MANKKLKNFEYANQTARGQLPSLNTDRLSFFECVNGFVFIIADGKGSDELGVKSAQLAVERITYYLENEYVEKASEALFNAIIYANGFIYEQVRKNPEDVGMGVSCCCVLIRDNQAFYCSIGDSRIYFYNGKRIYLISQGDFSIAPMEEENDSENLKEESAGRYLGQIQNIVPLVNTEPLVPLNDDMILLASDGLYEAISEKSIQKILSDPMPAQTKIYRLIDLANLQSGSDNISAQLIAFYNLDHEERKFVPVKEKSPQKKDRDLKSFVDKGAIIDFIKEIVSQPLYKIVLIVIAALLLSYMFYDVFLYNPKPARKIITETLPQENETTTGEEQTIAKEPAQAESKAIKLPADVTYMVKSGDTWNRIYSEFGVCSWFIRTHPSNAGKFDSADNPISGQRLVIPVSYSARRSLNPDFYQEFSLQKTGSRCENANEAFLEKFKAEKLR